MRWYTSCLRLSSGAAGCTLGCHHAGARPTRPASDFYIEVAKKSLIALDIAYLPRMSPFRPQNCTNEPAGSKFMESVPSSATNWHGRVANFSTASNSAGLVGSLGRTTHSRGCFRSSTVTPSRDGGYLVGMTYMFRVRFKVGRTTRIDAKVDELVLNETGGVRVFLRSLTAGQLVSDAEELALRGEGYATDAQAVTEGNRWIGALILGMISEFVGIDFGNRSPAGWFSPAGLELFSASNPDLRPYNDIAGLLVAPQSPEPVFIRVQASAIAGKNGDAIAAHIREAFSQQVGPDERSLLACEMYAASHLMPSEDSRFLMLMIAVEALIEAGTRPPAQVQAIDALAGHVAALELSEEERGSLRQTLAGLKTESINSAGKRLAATLGDGKYGGKPPKPFFVDCYGVRSSLVHGNLGRANAETIRGLIGPLEHLVRDLVLKRNGLA